MTGQQQTPVWPTGSDAEEQQPTRVRRTVFVLACGASWFLYLHRYTWNVVGPELQRTLELDNTELGMLFSAFNIAYGVGQIPSGILCDFFGTHLFLGTTIVIWSLALPAFGLTTSLYVLAALRVIFGAAQAGCYPALTKVTHAWFPLGSRTTVQGWVATFFGRGGGAMSSIILGTLLMGYFGLSWQSALVLMGGAGVTFGLLFLILFRNSPEVDPRVNPAERELIQKGTDHAPDPNLPRVLPFGRAARNRSLWFFVLQGFLSAGADIFYVSFVGVYFLTAQGFDVAKAGVLVSLPLWGGALGGVAGGALNDWFIRRTGNRRWSRSSVGFFGKLMACGLMFVMIRQTSGEAAALVLFWVKFFSDTSQPTVWGTCTDLGGRYSGTVFSIINTANTLGAFTMPVVFGWMLDLNTRALTIDGAATRVTDWNPLFYLIAAMYVLAALSWLLIDCTRSLEREDRERSGPRPAEETS